MATIDDVALLEQLAAHEARNDFWAFRQFMNPKLVTGWFPRELARSLQSFYDDYIAGNKPKLLLSTPPQHGKSSAIIDFAAWLAGQNPDNRIIFASFSERLGVRANLALQRIMDSKKYRLVFPGTTLAAAKTNTALRNRDILSFVGHDGFFRNTTTGGAITGESLDIGIIDDPVKGREEANSATVRDKLWDWFLDDFMTRFSEDAGLLVIGTRWHLDDPIGRMIETMKGVKVIRYPAIAEHAEPFRKQGEALFPELKSLDFLLERKAAMPSSSWEALYQQNPVAIGGNVIKTTWFQYYTMLPRLQYRIITADTAMKTKEANDYSVLQCWGRAVDGRVYLIDQVRGKFEAPELERRVIAFWNKHKAESTDERGALRALKIEDKASGTGLIQSIKRQGGIPIIGLKADKDKFTRVMDILPAIEAGLVVLPSQAPWLSDLLAELEAFSADGGHQHDDQVDALCYAVADLLGAGNVVKLWENML